MHDIDINYYFSLNLLTLKFRSHPILRNWN